MGVKGGGAPLDMDPILAFLIFPPIILVTCMCGGTGEFLLTSYETVLFILVASGVSSRFTSKKPYNVVLKVITYLGLLYIYIVVFTEFYLIIRQDMLAETLTIDGQAVRFVQTQDGYKPYVDCWERLRPYRFELKPSCLRIWVKFRNEWVRKDVLRNLINN